MVLRHARYVRLVKISVLLLRLGDDVDYIVHASLQLGVGLYGQQIGRALHHLIQVGRYVAVNERQLALLAPQKSARAAQILHRRLRLVQRERHQRAFLRAQAREPEIILQRHSVERRLSQRSVAVADGIAAEATDEKGCDGKSGQNAKRVDIFHVGIICIKGQR